MFYFFKLMLFIAIHAPGIGNEDSENTLTGTTIGLQETRKDPNYRSGIMDALTSWYLNLRVDLRRLNIK